MTTQEQANKFFQVGSNDEVYGKVVNVNTNGYLTVEFENNVIKSFEYDEELNIMIEL